MKKIYVAYAILVAFVLSVYITSYGGITVPVYTLESEKIEGDTVNLVLIADLHSLIYGKNQEVLIEHVKRQNPDMILLAGDIADDKIPILGTSLFLEGIQDLCPIYYTTGNHEYWADDIQEIRDEIRKYGVRILEDEYVNVMVKGTPFVIAGIDDPEKARYEDTSYNQHQSMQEAFGNLEDAEGYKILIAHRPERIEQYLAYPFDLIVSGHTHGGQVRIPFLLNGLYVPNQGVFPKYGGGLYQHGDTVHIISRGLAKDIKPRPFNPPEVVVITLEANEAK